MLSQASSDHGDTFRSYVDVYRDSETSPAAVEKPSDLTCFKDEIVSSQCDDVLFFPPFRENIFGKLYCTNFRICFVPLAVQHRDPCCSRSLILDDDFHFSVCSIEAIHYASTPISQRSVTSSKKFRVMNAPASQLEIISCIKVFTKDFRVWTFDLQRSQSAVNLANSIFHFSRPVALPNFFQLSSRTSGTLPRSSGTKIAFNNPRDWTKELNRCGVKEALWKIFFLSDDTKRRRNLKVSSYPSCVVVLSEITDSVIFETLAPNWRNHRFPVWCWSAPNGSALLRSSKCCRDLEADELWQMVLLPLSRAHPKHRVPHLVEIDIAPSRIASAYEKLRDLCSVETNAQFNERDKEWHSLLDATGWCTLVFKCLSIVRTILRKMVEAQRSVVISEDTGFDLSAVVSSLVQICADRYYRTVGGLNSLIEKEWIALGHPFGVNIFNCALSTGSPEPLRSCTATFLLFLDCVYQLIHIYPASFEYSQYQLIAVWDLCVMGLAPALTCNSVSDQIALERDMAVFPLSQYYSSKYCIMFTNVAYSANHLLGVGGLPTVLEPTENPLDIEFWSECYLRWVSPANIQGGGGITYDLAMSLFLAKVASVVSPSCEPVVWRQRLHPGLESKKVSSSFPYSEATETDVTPGDVVQLARGDSFKSLKVDLNATYPMIHHVERRFSGSTFLHPSRSPNSNSSKDPRHLFPSTLV